MFEDIHREVLSLIARFESKKYEESQEELISLRDACSRLYRECYDRASGSLMRTNAIHFDALKIICMWLEGIRRCLEGINKVRFMHEEVRSGRGEVLTEEGLVTLIEDNFTFIREKAETLPRTETSQNEGSIADRIKTLITIAGRGDIARFQSQLTELRKFVSGQNLPRGILESLQDAFKLIRSFGSSPETNQGIWEVINLNLSKALVAADRTKV